jgi:dTMP kinase
MLNEKHDFPGKLIIVEGIDGSGKSTQLLLLQRWLQSLGLKVFFTEWNSSPLVKKASKAGKKKGILTPTTFSLLHATDFADRLASKIIPPLKAGMVVLADRYAFTAFARDAARGVHRDWVRRLYDFSVRPDMAFYFRVPIDVSLKRLLVGRTQLKYYEAGMDLHLSTDPVESFRLFQTRVLKEYDRMVKEYGLIVIDARESISTMQRTVREIAQKGLGL